MDVNRFGITVDGVSVAVRPGQNLLQACLSAKRDIPYFCWHPALGSVGSCRQCAVTVFDGAADTTGQIVMACMTQVTPGMRVSIAGPPAATFREQVIEFVLTAHPHDCPVCEVGGECHLQDMTVLTGHAERRYRFAKRSHLNQNLGPFIRHEMNRCIGCYRCVRFYRDYAGGTDFGVFGASSGIYFGRAAPGTLESDFAGNLVEICPTGVFVDKPFSARFRRKWDMRATPSVCPHCAVGCNITIAEREGSFRRVTNRYHAAVNGYFLCDRGRFGTGFIESAARLRVSRQRAGAGPAAIDHETAATALAEFATHDGVIGIGSPRASIEANFALRALVGAGQFYAGVSDQDAAIVAEAVGLMRDHAVPIATLADAEQADAVLILGDDPSDIAPRLALALRQAAQRATAAALAARQVAPWNDVPARAAASSGRGRMVIATPAATRLDDVAAAAIRCAPDAVIALGVAVARHIDHEAAEAERPGPEPAHAAGIAEALRAAHAPVIVAGGAQCGAAVLPACANIVIALRRAGVAARLVLLLAEANSLGLGLMTAAPLSAALTALRDGAPRRLPRRLIVLENDLDRRAEAASLDDALAQISALCVLDHIDTPLTRRADLTVAVGCFADGDGSFVNAEGRAQAAFKAIFHTGAPPEAWRALRDAGIAAGRFAPDRWQRHADLLAELAAEIPALAGCRQAWPVTAPDAMHRPPSLPHRYSGRTAVDADRDVRESLPPQHPDSPFGTTMEGAAADPASSIAPSFWAPGWNSVQAVNKFQTEIGGELAGGGGGARLFGQGKPAASSVPVPPIAARPDGVWFLPATRVFGSEELSALAPAIIARVSPPTVAFNPQEVARLALAAGDRVECTIGGTSVVRVLVIDDALPDGIASIVTACPGEGALILPGIGDLLPC